MVVLLRGNDVKIEWRLTFSGELSDYSNGRLYVYCDSEDIDVPFQLVDNVLYATIAGNQLKVGVYSMVFISTGESQFLRKKVSKAFEITEDEQSVVEGVVIADSSAYGRTMYSLTDVLSNRDNDSVEGAKEGHVLTYTNGLWRGMPSRGGSGEGGGASTEYIDTAIQGIRDYIDGLIYLKDGTLFTDYPFASLKSIATKGIGSSSSGGGGSLVNVMQKWPTNWDGSYQSYALGAGLGWQLKEGISVNSESIEKALTRIVGLEDVSQQHNQAIGKITTIEKNYEEIKDELKDYAKLLDWFDIDSEGNVYTTFNFYSTQAISTKGVGSGSSGSGGGASMLYQLYDVQANAEGNQVAGAVKGNVLTFNGKRWEGTTIEIPDVDFSEITTQINALAGEVSKKQDKGELDETLINYNDRIKDNTDNISKILKWFTLDEENGVLFTTYNLASEQSIATKGIGTSSGGGGNSYPRLDRWENYDAANGAVLSATLGYELYDKLLPVSKDFLTSLPQRLQQAEAGVDGVNGALAAINDTLATHTEDIDTNETAIKSINAKLTPIENAVNAIKNWFTLEDDTLITEYNLASKKSVSTKGIGSSNGGGGNSYNRLDAWPSEWDDTYGLYVLGAGLGYELKNSIDALADADVYWNTIVGRPTKLSEFVNDAQFITSDALSGLALKGDIDALDSRIDALEDFNKHFQIVDGVILVDSPFASLGAISTKGIGDSNAGGGGVSYSRLDTWDGYTTDKAGYVLSAKLGWDLKTQLDNLDINDFDLSNYYTKENVNNLLRSKQDTINDLDAYAKTAAIQQWVIDQSYATTGQFEGITLILDAHDARILANENNIKGVDDRLKKVEAWFTLEDDVLMTEHNLASSQSIATKGIGASSGSGGVVPWSELENSIIPKVTDTYSIGTNTNKWQSIYAIEGHINSLVAHALSAESIKLNGKDVATKEYVIAMVAQGGGGGGTGGSSTVSYLPTIEEGKEIGTLIVDGVSYGLFAPSRYSWDDIDDIPNFAKVAFGGSYNDLTDVPTFYTLTIQKNGVEVGTFTPNSKNATINIDDVVTLSDEQEITGRKTFTGGVRLDSNTVIRNAQLIGINASDAVLWKVDNTGNATFVNGVLGGTLSVTKESTFTGETTHNGGIVIPSGKTLKIGNTVIEEKDGGLFVNGDLAASGSVATKGVGSSSGGGGNSYGRLDDWDNYNASNGDVLSALLGYGLKNDIATLTSKFNNYFTKNETRNEIVAYLGDFNAEMIIPNYSTKSEVGSLADVVGGIGSRVSTLESKATAVSFAQTLQSGKQIGVLTIDGTPTTLFAPASYAWGEITSRPTKLSDFTDDVVSGKYLPLSGGTLSGNIGISSGYDAKIILNETGSDSKYQYIAFQDNGVVYGMLGTFGNNNLVWNGETIIHRGNYTEYTYSKEQVDTKFSSVLKSSMLTNVALDDINAIDGDENRWNNSSKSFVLVNFNNAIAFTVGGVNNNRAANIQVGHSIGAYAQYLGKLYLNKLGGDVYIGENLAIHEGNIGSQSVASADKLSDNTAYTAWGQTFFENGKPKRAEGNLILRNSDTLCTTDTNDKRLYTLQLNTGNNLLFGQYTAKEGYDTLIYGNNISLCYGPAGSSSYTGLFINSSGDTGIGTTSPSYKLDVNGSLRIKGQALGLGGAIDFQFTDEINRYGGTLYIQHRGDGSTTGTGSGATGNVVMCKNGGDVGIGTSSPSAKLDVKGTGRFTGDVIINGNVLIGTTTDYGYKLYVDGGIRFAPRTIWGQSFDGTGNVSGSIIDCDFVCSTNRSTDGYYIGLASSGASPYEGLLLYTYGNTPITMYTSKTERLRILSNGNVGIGTTNPEYKHHIVGESLISQSANGNLFYRARGVSYELAFGLGSGGTNRGIYDFTHNSWMIYRDRTTNVLIPNGNVLIGTTTDYGYKLYIDGTLASTGAITIANTLYGIGTTGVIRGSKLVSEGTIETSTLKVGSILIEDKDGDLFINGNLAASGSVATKGIGTSSSGGSGTIPWSALENSLISASTSYNLGSSAKPWGSVYANSGTINKFTVGSTKIGDTTGYWSITHAGVASFSSVKVNGYNVATEQSVASSLSNYLLKSGGDIEGDLSLFGDYVRFRNCHVLGLSDSGSTQYWSISNVGAASFASLKIGNYNAATQDYVQNNFAANFDARIDSSLTVYSTNRNMPPTIKLESSDWIWDVRNEPSALSFYSISPSGGASSVMALNTSGDLSISGRLTQSSDETLKNILGYNVDMKVRDIANAPICYFTWKDRVSERQIGTIAQYWKLITPECVVGEEGRMSMDYSTLGLVSSIVNAREIVKHEDEIEALKKRVKELEDKLAAVSAA